jgi:trans-aconitate methyltransferase
MDTATLEAYDRDPEAYARDWHEQPAPADLHTLVRRWFAPGPTADIGCGAGRDTAWLSENGFPATGYDASAGLLAEAARRHPAVAFHHGVLPQLEAIPDGAYTNVLCETVIMHLEPDALAPALHRLLAILAPGGTLYLTWRVTRDHHRRDEHGRLYAVVDAAVVREALSPEEVTSASSGKTIHRIIARKATAES